MQGLLAICGIVILLFLYSAGVFLAVNTVKQASRWFEEQRLCREWPRTRRNLMIKSLDRDAVPCELPRLSEEPHARLSPAKEILREACDEICSLGVDVCSH